MKSAGAPAVMDNDANVGALGESSYGACRGASFTFLHDALHRHWGRHRGLPAHFGRGADSYAGEIGHITIRPGGPECLCGARGCLERFCCGLWLQRDHGRAARELLMDPAFVEHYVVDLALGLKAAIMF